MYSVYHPAAVSVESVAFGIFYYRLVKLQNSWIKDDTEMQKFKKICNF